jgi:ABC-type phosphate transport system substrate-binding protein
MLAIMTVAAVKQSTPAIGIADLSFYANDGTAQVDASGVVLQNSYRQFTQNYAVMPNGSAVSAANLAAAEWGILVEEGA